MQGYENLTIYRFAYRLAMELFRLSPPFPKEERYALTDQIRRLSRSVAANKAEGYRKRQYPKMFLNKLSDADSELAETGVWLNFAYDCGYLAKDQYLKLLEDNREIGRMLGGMLANGDRFTVRQP